VKGNLTLFQYLITFFQHFQRINQIINGNSTNNRIEYLPVDSLDWEPRPILFFSGIQIEDLPSQIIRSIGRQFIFIETHSEDFYPGW